MTLLFYIGMLCEALGTIMVTLAVLGVHQHIYEERTIDPVVLRSLLRDRRFAYIGLLLIVVGFVLEFIFFFTNGIG